MILQKVFTENGVLQKVCHIENSSKRCTSVIETDMIVQLDVKNRILSFQSSCEYYKSAERLQNRLCFHKEDMFREKNCKTFYSE